MLFEELEFDLAIVDRRTSKTTHRKAHNHTVRPQTRVISFFLDKEDSPQEQPSVKESQSDNGLVTPNLPAEENNEPKEATQEQEQAQKQINKENEEPPKLPKKPSIVIDMEDAADDPQATPTERRLPIRGRSKGILGLNRQCSSERKEPINNRFRLIGADLKKALKKKIDNEFNNCQNLKNCKLFSAIMHILTLRLAEGEKIIAKSFSMRDNPILRDRSVSKLDLNQPIKVPQKEEEKRLKN